MNIKLTLFIGLGGMIGALLRYSISALSDGGDGFPYTTLIINLIGCFWLTFLLNHDKAKQKLSSEVRVAIGTGVIGSFTTFSTFAMETIQLSNNNTLLAIAYISLSIFGGLIFCYIGYKLAHRGQRLDRV